jgi:hypothetical protein
VRADTSSAVLPLLSHTHRGPDRPRWLRVLAGPGDYLHEDAPAPPRAGQMGARLQNIHAYLGFGYPVVSSASGRARLRLVLITPPPPCLCVARAGEAEPGAPAARPGVMHQAR